MADVERDEELRAVLARLGARLDGVGVAALKAREGMERRRAMLDASGIADVLSPHGYDAIVEDRATATRAIELVQAWLTGHRRVLGLFGPPDAGKTVAAAYALARVPGLYVEADELAADRKGKLRARALRVELLVIDELGAEDDERRARAALNDTLNRRLRRRTLLLGNIDAGTFEARYDERTLSRLREVGTMLRLRATGLRARVGAA